MLSHVTPETALPAVRRGDATDPQFNGQPKPIADFVALPDFPKCALGEHVDIGGFTGVLIEIVNQSIKIKSPAGKTGSFNIHRLRVLYGPAIRPEPMVITDPAPRAAKRAETPRAAKVEAPKPKREFIAKPDFAVPVRPINDLAGRIQFPACAYGEHVDIAGFTGVVVEIINGSLKVRSAEGSLRSYNAGILRNLYGTNSNAKHN